MSPADCQPRRASGWIDGVGSGDDAERLTHVRIRAFAAANPTVYLVAHDPETGGRLRERLCVHRHPSAVEVAALSASRQTWHRPVDRGGLRLRLGSAQLPALELCCS